MTGYGEPVTCAGAEVTPGDLVRRDEDGVVVPAALAADAIAAAEEKLGLERLVAAALERRETAADLYARYGVL